MSIKGLFIVASDNVLDFFELTVPNLGAVMKVRMFYRKRVRQVVSQFVSDWKHRGETFKPIIIFGAPSKKPLTTKQIKRLLRRRHREGYPGIHATRLGDVKCSNCGCNLRGWEGMINVCKRCGRVVNVFNDYAIFAMTHCAYCGKTQSQHDGFVMTIQGSFYGVVFTEECHIGLTGRGLPNLHRPIGGGQMPRARR